MKFIVFITGFFLTATSHAQIKVPDDPRIKKFTIQSKVLGREKKFLLIEPTGFDASKAYPLAFMFHNLTKRKDSAEYIWVGLFNLIKNTADVPMLIVTPSADSAYFTNRETDNNEDFFAKELPEFVFSKYNVDKTKVAAIGASNGGFNSLLLGLRHPELIKFVGDISAPLIVPRDIEKFPGHPVFGFAYAPSIYSFGPPGHPNRSAYDVFELTKKADTAQAPYFFLAMGIQDRFTGFLARHRELAELFSTRGIKYEYHEMPGGHTYRFWDTQSVEAIRCMRRVLKF